VRKQKNINDNLAFKINSLPTVLKKTCVLLPRLSHKK